MSRNQLQTKKEEAKTRKKLEMKEFLESMRNLSMEELEAMYPREVFYHAGKIMEYKLLHTKLDSTWDGDLTQKNYWVFGATGTGKSRWAHKQGNADEIYPKTVNKWWGGFKSGQHKVVLIEDFPLDGYYLVQHLKIWADRYAFIGEVKGSEITVYPGSFILIITSNHSISDIFDKGSELDCNAIKRRFTEVKIEDRNDIFLQTEIDKSIII